jgi:protein TonB
MAAYARYDTAFFSRRAIIFIAVIIFHIILFYVFQSGLATRIMKAVEPPLETTIVADEQKHNLPPPPPPPKMERPPVEVPPPDVVINLPAESTSTAITQVTSRPVAPPAPRAPDVRTRAQLDQRHSPSTDDYYPPASRRMSETGSTTVNVCLDEGGKQTGTPTVGKSSGSSRLDEAAVSWASHARFVLGTLNGKPIADCTAFRVTFKLTD